MTLDQLIARQKEQIASKLAERNTKSEELTNLRSADTVDEAKVTELRTAKDALDAEIDQLQARTAELETEQARDDAALRLSREVTPANKPAYDEVTRTGQEPRTYTRQTAHEGTSFFADAFRSEKLGDFSARTRLERHAREVEVHNERTERAVATGGFAGLVVPQYLVEWAAPKLRAGRGIANVVNRLPLPAEGMNIVIPRGTTGASVDVQATENSAVSNTDEAWVDLTIPVRTVSGQQDVSRQSLERAQGNDQLIYMDLARAYGARLGTQVINGSGSAGQVKGILNTAGIGAATAFGAVPDHAIFNRKIAGANAAVYGAGEGIAPDVLVMHPRRWGWLSGLTDSQGRTFVTANTVPSFNAGAVGQAVGEAYADAGVHFAGTHVSGLPVLLDNNVPTNVGTNVEDVILSVDSDELLLWEDGDGMPRQLSFEQTTGGSLTTKLVVYGYVAFTAERYPEASAKVGGLDSTATYGLVAPTF